MRRGGRAHMERLYDADFTELLQQRHIHAGYWDDGVYDGDLAAAQDRYVTRLFELTEVVVAGHVLDLGCGPGGVSVHLADRARRVTGLDLSLPQLRLAQRATRGSSVGLVLADATSLPFRPGAFDLAVAVESCAHVADKARLAREIRRVLRVGGRAVLSDYAVEPQSTRRQRLYVRAVAETPTPPPLAELIDHLESNGLKVDKVVDTAAHTVIPWVDALLAEPHRSRMEAYVHSHYHPVIGRLTRWTLGPIARRFAASFREGCVRHVMISTTAT